MVDLLVPQDSVLNEPRMVKDYSIRINERLSERLDSTSDGASSHSSCCFETGRSIAKLNLDDRSFVLRGLYIPIPRLAMLLRRAGYTASITNGISKQYTQEMVGEEGDSKRRGDEGKAF